MRRTFLRPKELAAHQSQSRPSLLLLRHLFAEDVMRRYLLSASRDPFPRLHSVPEPFRKMVHTANGKIPSPLSRDHICHLSLWRIFHRSHISSKSPAAIAAINNPNHDTIYIYERGPCLDEASSNRLIRRDDPSTGIYPVSRTLKYTSCVFLQQAPQSDLFYGVTGLEHRRHGSAQADDLFKHRANLVAMQIQPHVLAPPYRAANHCYFGTAKSNGVLVIGQPSATLRKFHLSFPNSLVSFQSNLAAYITLNNPQNDLSRVKGKVHNDIQSWNTRLTFGFTREQSSKHSQHFYNGKKLPRLNTVLFAALPKHLQNGLFHVMETGTKIAQHNFPNAFCDTFRTNLYASLLNTTLQFSKSCNKFEYVDIVVSHNTVLPAHLDKNNDHRPGYNHTVVYSFQTKVNGKVCRVAIIMCTRTVVGANKKKITNFK